MAQIPYLDDKGQPGWLTIDAAQLHGLVSPPAPTPPPGPAPVPAPTPPPPPSPAPGTAVRRLPFFVRADFDMKLSDLPAAKARGRNLIASQWPDWSDGNADAWVAGCEALGLYMALIPGLRSNQTFAPDTFDVRSRTDQYLKHPMVLMFAGIDEAGTADRNPTTTPNAPQSVWVPRRTPDEFQADVDFYNARADALVLPRPIIWANGTDFVYRNEAQRAELDVRGVEVRGMDYYFKAYGGRRLIGTTSTNLPHCSTHEGLSLYLATQGATYDTSVASAPVAALGAEFIAFLQGGAIGTGGAIPTPAENNSIAASIVINGASGIAFFNTKVDTPFVNDNWSPTLDAWNAKFNQDLDRLQAAGFLMAPTGGRTDGTTRHCPLSRDPGNFPSDTPVWCDPVGDQMPGGFEARTCWNADRSASVKLIGNLEQNAKMLSDPGYGITRVPFAPGQWRALQADTRDLLA